jgi:hypothetical protein
MSGGHAEPQTPVERARERFARSVEQEFAGVSPLYARLAAGLAGDVALCALAAQARPGQPLPVFFLGAVHYLLRKEPDHPLAAFYPDLAGETVSPADPFPTFRAFCLEHQAALLDLLATRRVQTNEVQRCACLLPAFSLVAERGGNSPLALVEVGASAGLNLLWDRYGYRYSDGTQVGDPHAPVQIACTLRGDRRPPLPAMFPPIASRVGLDLNPVNLRDPDAVRWLRALIWPEQANRAALLEQAVAGALADPPPLLAGDALALLPQVFAAVPPNTTLCVWHSYTLNQFPREARDQFAALLAVEATRRDLYDIWMEGFPGDRPHIRLLAFRAGERTEQILAHCSPHGYWLEWLNERPL